MKGTTATAPYISLPMGEEFYFVAESDPGTIPIDGSSKNLRQYSPFVIEIIPPNQNYGRTSPISQLPFSSPLSPAYNARSQRNSAETLPRLSSVAGAPVTRTLNDPKGRDGVTPTIQALTPDFSDRNVLMDIATQAYALDVLPPVVFLINPSTFDVSYNSIQAYQDTTRYGFVFQRFGEELPTISMNCAVGAFLTGRANPESPDSNNNLSGPSGLTSFHKRDSAAYRHLMIMLSIFKNSGAIADRLGRSRAYHAVGRQAIHYDGQMWEGRIESLNFSEDESHQNGLITFDMSFVVYRHVWKDSMTSTIQKRLTNLNDQTR